LLGKRFIYLTASILIGIFNVVVFLGVVDRARASVSQKNAELVGIEDPSLIETQQMIYLPITLRYYPWNNPFGVEPYGTLKQGSKIVSNTVNLQAGWIRLNRRISWRSLQPEEGAPIQWDELAKLESELRILREADLTPVVIINDFPYWATDNTVREDGLPTSCGRLRDDKLDDFAVFVTGLVNRYKTSEWGVHNWELGNEPDVDPNYVPPNNQYGCWGDATDLYYGGEAYGRMIIRVGEAIKAADPLARVWIGGLLLGAPNATNPNEGHQELFFEGILRSGAAPYFDIVPYHWYPSYGREQVRDFDLLAPSWESWGGGTVGKARFLRQVMQAYGVSKPVVLNETSFGCPYDWPYVDWCYPPSEAFFDLQASYVVRTATRAYNENISAYIWYTIDGPSLRWWGLLDKTKSPKPVYWAYAQLISQFQNSRPLGSVFYVSGIEAYAFNRGSNRLDVLWAIEDQTITVTVPISDWIGAYGRFGEMITPTVNGTDYLLPVGFNPVYLVLQP
jgi:hypothetical protein